jgi:ParB family chromosome partitioning protein
MPAEPLTPESAATWESIDSLTPWEQNPRINEHAVGDVADSIRRFGFGSPIIARAADRVVIAGHTRLKAALSLGLDRVPVRFLDLDPADAKLLALADNRVGEKAEWETSKLADVLRQLNDEKIDLGSLGFDRGELDALLGVVVDPELDTSPQLDDALEWRVVIECASEAEQARAIDLIREGGFSCRSLMS